MKFDPESYSITIRKEIEDGEMLYVGRVAELPNISVFEETFEAAHTLLIDAIQTLKKIADEQQVSFPAPYLITSDEFSGRVTLRLPKSLHAKVSQMAAQDDASINQYLVSAIASYVGETHGASKAFSEASNLLQNVIFHATTTWKATQFLFSETTSAHGATPLICIPQRTEYTPLRTGVTGNA